MLTVNELLEMLTSAPELVVFADVIAVIDMNYHYTPCEFKNGLGDKAVVNAAGTNEGSCKIFTFAALHHLNEAQTLACFGDYYRKDVLNNPDGSDHRNIRNFIRDGWAGIEFSGTALA